MNDSSEAVCDTRTVISNPRRITADWTIEYPPEILELSKRTDLTKIASTWPIASYGFSQSERHVINEA